MFTKKTPEHAGLDSAIDNLLIQLNEFQADDDEYAKMVKQLSALYAIRESNSRRRLSPDTVAIILGNLAGICLIIGHERVNVISTKAIGFVMKAK